MNLSALHSLTSHILFLIWAAATPTAGCTDLGVRGGCGRPLEKRG